MNKDEQVKSMNDEDFLDRYGRLVQYTINKNFSPEVLSAVYQNTSLEYEDLIQIGLIGLCKARNKFDTQYGYSFSTYAVPLILGEIQTALRENSKIKGFSRSTYYLRQKIIKADMLRSPTDEIKSAFGVAESEVKAALNFCPTYLYFNSLAQKSDEGRNIEFEESIPAEFNLEDDVTNKVILNQFINNSLSEKEKQAWYLCNVQEMRQSEAAKVMGISQAHVCRMLKSVYRKAESYGKAAGLYK